MRGLPSKRKVQIINSPPSCIKALTSLPENSEHPYSLLMQIYRNGTNKSFVQTPSKSKNKPTHRSPMIWTIIKAKESPFSQDPKSTLTRLSVMRQKSQLRREKIQFLTKQITKVSELRIKLSNVRLQILESLKSVDQIRRLYYNKQATLDQIKRLIQQIRLQRQKAYIQLDQTVENISNLHYKFEECKENHEHLEEKKSNLSYALDSQRKKNKNLKQKQYCIENQLLNGICMQSLSKQIFQILILLTQQKNVEILRKNGVISNPNKKKKNKNNINISMEQQNRIKICYENKQFLKKIPYCLIILSQVFMYLRMKKIDRMYLNKISYFCNQTKRVFEMQEFYKLVTDYFIQHCQSYWENVKSEVMDHEEVQMQQQSSNTMLDEVQKQIENSSSTLSVKEEAENSETILMLACVSKTCQCRNEFINLVGQKKLERLLKKYFKVKIVQFEQTEECCYLKQMRSENEIKRGSESMGNFHQNEEQKTNKFGPIVKKEANEDEDCTDS